MIEQKLATFFLNFLPARSYGHPTDPIRKVVQALADLRFNLQAKSLILLLESEGAHKANEVTAPTNQAEHIFDPLYELKAKSRKTSTQEWLCWEGDQRYDRFEFCSKCVCLRTTCHSAIDRVLPSNSPTVAAVEKPVLAISLVFVNVSHGICCYRDGLAPHHRPKMQVALYSTGRVPYIYLTFPALSIEKEFLKDIRLTEVWAGERSDLRDEIQRGKEARGRCCRRRSSKLESLSDSGLGGHRINGTRSVTANYL
ncbi:Vps51/Vps67 family (components of vesiculartransport) protein [Striga asiatica]|uniref:Vps51/Vps67 family (Components of vesiculartransport) protein n=1 Tax=Striga asiatica TaxID=4170 RepID=A0A5A7QRV7_STRAF|nr:Vps51/Vps67 family (components of vesiculartransport) protein [Striga asiatica]